MRLLAGLLLAGAAQAQVVECPQTIKEAPAVNLTGGSMYDGPNHEYELIGTPKGAKGRHYGFDGRAVKWLACWYGRDGKVAWWKMDAKATSCSVGEQRKAGRVSVRAVCK
ncbi:MAG: STY0301 family protein [Massilia sp.]